MATSTYALRFISGKYQGGEFPVRMDREIIIGRQSDLDMVLVEDMVSRKHAKITSDQGLIYIQDMGSTNGTFVNGEKVRQTQLKDGDRILIGTSIIKLVAVEGASPISEEVAREKMEQTERRRAQVAPPNKPMSGSISEIPLPDLLQLLSTSRKSGVLTVRNDDGTGRIYLRKGQIYFSTIDDSFDLSPRKAAYRMLTWQTGSFELEPPDDKAVLEELTESTEALLMEGMRQLDEYRRLEKDLPPLDQPLGLSVPVPAPLRDLQPVDLDVLELVINAGMLAAILDQSPRTDLETVQSLIMLLDKGYITRVS